MKVFKVVFLSLMVAFVAVGCSKSTSSNDSSSSSDPNFLPRIGM